MYLYLQCEEGLLVALQVFTSSCHLHKVTVQLLWAVILHASYRTVAGTRSKLAKNRPNRTENISDSFETETEGEYITLLYTYIAIYILTSSFSSSLLFYVP